MVKGYLVQNDDLNFDEELYYEVSCSGCDLIWKDIEKGKRGVFECIECKKKIYYEV